MRDAMDDSDDAVRCRIGSSEKPEQKRSGRLPVRCRIGSSEKEQKDGATSQQPRAAKESTCDTSEPEDPATPLIPSTLYVNRGKTKAHSAECASVFQQEHYMSEVKFPYQGWVLTHSFKPVEKTFQSKADHYEEWHYDENGKGCVGLDSSPWMTA